MPSAFNSINSSAHELPPFRHGSMGKILVLSCYCWWTGETWDELGWSGGGRWITDFSYWHSPSPPSLILLPDMGCVVGRVSGNITSNRYLLDVAIVSRSVSLFIFFCAWYIDSDASHAWQRRFGQCLVFTVDFLYNGDPTVMDLIQKHLPSLRLLPFFRCMKYRARGLPTF